MGVDTAQPGAVDEMDTRIGVQSSQLHFQHRHALGVVGIPLLGGELRQAVEWNIFGQASGVADGESVGRAVIKPGDYRRGR